MYSVQLYFFQGLAIFSIYQPRNIKPSCHKCKGVHFVGNVYKLQSSTYSILSESHTFLGSNRHKEFFELEDNKKRIRAPLDKNLTFVIVPILCGLEVSLKSNYYYFLNQNYSTLFDKGRVVPVA